MLFNIEEKIDQLGLDVEKIRRLEENEQGLIDDIRDGYKKKYKTFGWVLEGPISLKTNSMNASKIFGKYEAFRRRYLYKNLESPFCVTLCNEEYNIPFMDLRLAAEAKQNEIIKNIASASAREIFDIEEDPIVKINVFITKDDTMIVLMKVFMDVQIPVSIFDLRRMIFSNMRAKGNADIIINNDEIEADNEEKNRICIEYWNNQFKEDHNPVSIPFAKERNSDNQVKSYTVNHKMDSALYSKINEYAKANKSDFETVVEREFARLLGEYSGTETPVIGVKQNLRLMQVMPLFINLNKGVKEQLGDLLYQQDRFVKHSECYLDDVAKACGFSIRLYFDVLLEFTKNNENSGKISSLLAELNRNYVAELMPRFTVNFIYNEEEAVVRYCYDSDTLTDNDVERIHDSFCKMIAEDVEKKTEFSWKSYILECKSDEEKLHNIEVTRKALYIKNGEFLMVNDPDELISLSESGYVGNYIVEDIVYEAGKSLSELGILVSGHIEERYVDIEGKIKTISVYKPGYIIGIESIVGTKKSAFSYVAADEVKIMWLPAEILKKTLKVHTDGYEALLEKTLAETTRVKRLWALD